MKLRSDFYRIWLIPLEEAFGYLRFPVPQLQQSPSSRRFEGCPFGLGGGGCGWFGRGGVGVPVRLVGALFQHMV